MDLRTGEVVKIFTVLWERLVARGKVHEARLRRYDLVSADNNSARRILKAEVHGLQRVYMLVMQSFL